MHSLFFILRIVTGLAAFSSFILICLIVFLRDTASTARQGAQVLGYAAKLFATAFTDGTAPKTVAWEIGPSQILIGVLSLAMLASVFTPGSRWFLHGVGALASIMLISYARMIFTGVSMEIVCLPFLLVWFGFYAMCLFWRSDIGPLVPASN